MQLSVRLTAARATRSSAAVPVPALIKRNTLLLAMTQAFVGMGTQLVPTFGAIMIERLLGSLALAGLGTSLLYLARMLVAFPIGWIMDRCGRKAGLLLGLLLSMLGAVAVGVAMAWASFSLFLAGLLVFGLGVGAGLQLRIAAADMYLPERRAEGLGYVLTGSVVGALGGPVLIGAAQQSALWLRVEPTALAWLLLPLVLGPSLALVFLIHPDPKAIAANLAQYYPGYQPVAISQAPMLARGASLRVWLRHGRLRLAFLATFAAHGSMAMMMALTPLAMAHQGQGLTMISLAVALHVVGMYGLSLPLGRMADQVGRGSTIVVGLIGVAVGAVLVPLTPDYWIATGGLALVGVGWSCVNVAVTALVADVVPPIERARAIGVVDSFGGLASLALPLAGGALAQSVGFSALAILAIVLVLVPLLVGMSGVHRP